MNAIEYKSKGKVRMAALLAIFALVACALVVGLPSEDTDAAGETVFTVGGKDGFTPIEDGSEILVAGGNYILQSGSATLVVNTTASGASAATIILMPGTSVTVSGSTGTNGVSIHPIVLDNAYTTSTSFGIAASQTDVGEITVSAVAGTADEKYPGELTISSEAVLANRAVTAAGDVSVVGELVSAGAIGNLKFAYSAQPTDGNITYYAAAPAEAIPSTAAGTYTIGGTAAIPFEIVGADEAVTGAFTVAQTETITNAPAVVFASEGITYPSTDAVITVTEGSISDDTTIAGVVCGMSVTSTDSFVYYAVADDYTLKSGETAKVYSGDAVITDYKSETPNTVTLTGVESTEGVSISSDGTAITVTSNVDDVFGIEYTGSLKSTQVLDVEYGYATLASGTWTYNKDAMTTSPTLNQDEALIVKNAEAGTDAITVGNITICAANSEFSSTEGLRIDAGAESAYSVSGTWDNGTVTVTGAVSVRNGAAGSAPAADTVYALTVPAEGTLVINNNITLTVPEYGAIVNNGTVSGPTAEGEKATIAVTGAYSGTIPEGNVVFTGELAKLTGAEWDYVVKDSSNNYTLMTVSGTEPIAVAESTTVSVRNAAADTAFTVGEGSTVTIAAGYSVEEDFVTIDYTAGLGGTIAEGATVTINGGAIGTLVVDGALNIEGAVTVTGLTVNAPVEAVEGTEAKVGGTVSVDAEATLTASTSSAIINNNVIDLYGTLALSASNNVAEGGVVNLVSTSVITLGTDSSKTVFFGTQDEGDAAASGIVLSADGAAKASKFASGIDIEITAGSADICKGYNGVYTGTNLVIAEGVEVTFTADLANAANAGFANNGTITNSGDIVIAEGVVLTNLGKIVNNGTITVEGIINEESNTSSTADIENNGTITVTSENVLAAIGNITGTGNSVEASVSGENPYFQGTGWTYGVVETVKTLTINGNTDGAYFNFNADATIVIAAKATVDVTGADAFSSTGKLTFTGDYVLTVSAVAAENGAAVQAIKATGNLDIQADIVAEGGISGAEVTVTEANVTSVAAENGNPLTFTKLTVDGANLKLTGGILTITASSYVDSDTDAASTSIITSSLNIDNQSTISNTMIIVDGGEVAVDKDSSANDVIAYIGIVPAPKIGNIYTYNDVEFDIKVLTRTPGSTIATGSAIYNIFADAVNSTEANVVFVAVSEVDMGGITISKDMNVAADVTGSVIIGEGVTLTVGGTYTFEAGDVATVNGNLVITGDVVGGTAAEGGADAAANVVPEIKLVGTMSVAKAFTGTVNGVSFNALTGAAYAVGESKEIVVSAIDAEAALTGAFDVAAGQTVAIEEGTVLKTVTINGIAMTITAGAGLQFSIPAAEDDAPETDAPADEEQTPGEPSEDAPVEEVPETPEVMILNTQAEEPAEPVTVPPLNIVGDFTMNGDLGTEDAAIENLVITGGNITSSAQGEDVFTIYVKNLTLGDVNFGENIKIVVSGTLTVTGDVAGPEKFIELAGGSIVGEIDPSLVDAGTVVTAQDQASFESALLYNDTVVVTGDITLTSEQAEELVATEKVIYVYENHMITIGDNVTLNLTGTKVYAIQKLADGADVDLVNDVKKVIQGGTVITVAVGGTLVLNDVMDGDAVDVATDVYTNVIVEETEATAEQPAGSGTVTSNLVATEISGAGSTPSTIGYGRDLVITGSYSLTDSIAVYGEVLVNGILNVTAGSTISAYTSGEVTVSAGATMNVAGTVNAPIVNDGTVDVRTAGAIEGTVDNNGTLTVAGTVTGDVANDGTMTMNGTYAGTIVNKGALTFNGAAGADTEVVAYGDVTIQSVTGTLTVTDAGTVEAFKPADGKSLPAGFVQDGNTVTLTDVAGVTVAVTSVTAEGKYTDDTVFTYTKSVIDVYGTVALAEKKTAGSVEVLSVTGMEMAQTLDVAEGITLAIDGDVVISGTLNAYAVEITGDVTVTGEVKITAADADAAEMNVIGKLNATYYVNEVAATETAEAYAEGYYTAFDKAVAANTDAADVITVYGEQAALASQTFNGTIVVLTDAELTIGSSEEGAEVVVLTVAGTMRNLSAGVNVLGQLVFNDYSKYVESDAATASPVIAEPKIDADVVIIEDAKRIFTTLAIAIELGETDIILNGPVEINGNVTIPAGTTVSSDKCGVTVNNDSKLTVEGALELTKDSNGVILADAILEGTTPVKAAGKLEVAGNGHVYVPNNSDKYGEVAGVTGAHYLKEIVNTPAQGSTPATYQTVYVVSTVPYAADDAKNVVAEVQGDTPEITVVGKNDNVGDIVFALDPEDEDAALTVTLAQDAELNASSITIEPGVTVDASKGVLTGSVTSEVGTVDFEETSGAVIESVTVPAQGEAAAYDKLAVTGTCVKGDVTVFAGTAYVGLNVVGTEKAKSSFTVAQGATAKIVGLMANEYSSVSIDGTADVIADGVIDAVDMDGNGTADVDADGVINAVDMDVAGTLNIAAGTETDVVAIVIVGDLAVSGTVNAAGGLIVFDADIAGTVNVTGDMISIGAVQIDGTVAVSGEGASYEIYGVVTVAGKPAVLGTANGAGTLSGNVVITNGYVKAYFGADVQIDVEGTAYYVNTDYLYMTVYAPEGTTIMSIVYAETFQIENVEGLALDTGLYYGTPIDERNTGLYDPSNWFKTSNRLPTSILTGTETVGSVEAVYAIAEPVPTTVNITVGTGIALYIDGVPYTSGTYELSVGAHQVFLNVTAGFDATNAYVEINGTKVLTGTSTTATFTITGEEASFVINAGGAVTAGSGGSTIDPVINVETNDEMTLTDYLLIVLVVLIVIMAIIVALRLMRS